MSQTRDNPPGYNSLVLPNDYEYKIDGALAIGYTDGKLWDQSSIDQGLGAAKFSIVDKNNASKDISIRLEDHPEINDIGLNFCYEDSSLGTLKAYTYKEKSIMNSLRILENFGSDPNNSTNVLYEYVSQIQSILSFITGTTSLGASLNKDDVKEAVFANISKFVGIIGFDNNYDFVEDNCLNGQTSIPATNTIRLNVNLSKLVPSLDEPFTIVLNFNESDESNLFTINIENLKINDQYGCFTINMINGYDKFTSQIISENLKIQNFDSLIGDINNDNYVDLRDLPILVQFGISTTETLKYNINGELNLNLIGNAGGGFNSDFASRLYNVSVYVEILNETDNKQLHEVVCSIKIDDNSEFPSIFRFSDFIKTSTEILIYKDDVYLKQIEKTYKSRVINYKYSSTNFKYAKSTSSLFTSNIISWLILFILNNQTVYNAIDSTNQDIKPFDIIQYFENNSSNSSFEIGASLSPLDGKINIFYDRNNNYRLDKVTAEFNIKALGFNAITLSLDSSLDHNVSESTMLDKRNSILNKIYLFNNHDATKNLGYAATPLDSNIYNGSISSENVDNYLSYGTIMW